MDFGNLKTYTEIGLEGAGVLLLVVCAYKLLKMKIHTRSKCCGFLAETMNRGTSRSDLEFTPITIRDDKASKTQSSVI